MSQFYNPRRTRNLFDPSSTAPFRVSRSKIELFLKCPRCFYMDARLGVGRPPGYPFSLNSAVDHLLKKEFDFHRAKGTPHPLMEQYGVGAVPFKHKDLDIWRENFTGVQTVYEPANFLVTGAVDDVWQNIRGELIVVDYKATSKDGEVNLDAEWQDGYKNQMEIYQWLLRMAGFTVSDTGYFVYANGKKDRKAFDAKLEFDVKLIPYKGSTGWVNGALDKMKECLMDSRIPMAAKDCDYCMYVEAVNEVQPAEKRASHAKSRVRSSVDTKEGLKQTLF